MLLQFPLHVVCIEDGDTTALLHVLAEHGNVAICDGDNGGGGPRRGRHAAQDGVLEHLRALLFEEDMSRHERRQMTLQPDGA